MKFVAKTDIGKKREKNEDNYFAKSYSEDLCIFVVADGLGGYASGEVASKLLTQEVILYFEEHINSIDTSNEKCIKDVLIKAIELANVKIYELEKTDQKYKGMGTTIVLLSKINGKMYYSSVGDSRMYYINETMTEFQQVTVDDTYVNELIKTNVITKEEASTHPQRHVLTKAIGIFKHLSIEIKILDKENGYLLLCTDGLTNMLTEEDILQMFRKNKFEILADKLVQKANENGGVDNTTVIVVKL